MSHSGDLGRFTGTNMEGLGMTEAMPRTVAIVDDDEAVRDSLQFLLGSSGHVTEAFASAAEFFKSEMHHLACLILDHHMPHMTGLELLERLRDLGVGIPVLLITGSPSAAIAAQAAALGVERVLEKPPTERDLLDFVAGAMR
jgi:two-component system, LuxR family, response regulator FixJ